MLDALTSLKMEFTQEKQDLRRIEASTTCAEACELNKRSAVRNGLAFMLVCFALFCAWMAWNSYEVSQIKLHLNHSDNASDFDRFYADFKKSGGAKLLKPKDGE